MQGEAVAADQKRGDKPNVDTWIAPDPLAAVLPALAVLGTVSSIAAVHWVGQDRTSDRAKSKRRAGVALRELESCCLGVQEIFRRFHRNPKIFGGEGGTAASPMKFGVHGPRVNAEAARQYHQLVNDVASMLVSASQNVLDVTSAIEDGEIQAPDELFYGFGEVQEQLNKLITQRATLRACVEVGVAASERLTRLVGELKSHRVE
jgi:hypothetical protein